MAASPNTTFTELVSTGLRDHPSEMADNLSNHNALYNRLRKRGKLKVLDGGNSIVRPLSHAGGTTNYQRYSGYDQLNVATFDSITAAEFNWKQAAVHVSASGLELRSNSGKNQIIDLAAARLKNAMRDFANQFSSDMYSDGTATNQIGGLGLLVTNTGVDTVGGINASGNTWWKNQFYDSAFSASQLKNDLQRLWLACVRGADKPDLVIMEDTSFKSYWDKLTDIQRYSRRDVVAGWGFDSLMFNTADVVNEPTGSGIATNIVYMLNTDYLELVAHRDANMTELPEKRSFNQDAVIIPIVFQGNLCVSNRARQGKLF